MQLRVVNVLLQTALSGVQLLGQTEESKRVTKYSWANDVLRTLGFRLEVRGIPPDRATQILVGNHMSYLDILVLIAANPSAIFISKDDLLRWPIIGAGAKAAGTIFISRKPGTDRSISREQIVEKLKETADAKVVVFPSGTTTLDESRQWKKGIFEIAKDLRIPVQLFRIQYQPLRECAYIDSDNLLLQMAGLSKIKDKSVTLTWIEKFERVEDPKSFAEALRKKVAT